MERAEDTDGEEGIDEQAAVGYETCLETIEANHVDEEENQGDNKRNDAVLDSLLTKRRTYNILADDIDSSSHLT